MVDLAFVVLLPAILDPTAYASGLSPWWSCAEVRALAWWRLFNYMVWRTKVPPPICVLKNAP